MRNSFIPILVLVCLAGRIIADDNRTPIREFIEGIASVYDYKVSDEIPKCFDSQDEDMLYLLLKSWTQYSNQIVSGNLNGFVVSSLGVFRSMVSMGKCLECIEKTKDFKVAMEHLKLKKDITIGKFLKMVFLYTDSYPKTIADMMNRVFPLLERKEYKDGGIMLGKCVEDLIKEDCDCKIMKVNAFINGIFLRNGIVTPTTLRTQCIEEGKVENVVHLLKLYHEWARSLKKTDAKKAFHETIKYMMTKGFHHYTETGRSTWVCIRNSSDNKNFLEATKFNFDPLDQEFDFDLGVVLSDVKLAERYLKLMRTMRKVMNKRFRYYLLGGITFGSVIHMVSEHGSI